MDVIDIVIRSFRNDGSRFRPSDWIERVSSTLVTYNKYPEHDFLPSVTARPCIIDGEKCFVVNSQLAQVNPNAYDFIMQFAFSNNLSIKQDSKPVGASSRWSEFVDFQRLVYYI